MGNPILGVDIGGVIIDRVNDHADTAFFGPNYLLSKAVPDAFEALARLNRKFSGQVCIISKCGPAVQEKSKRWLAHHRFFEQTGIPETNLHFCRERFQKKGLCQVYGVTHFVDDRAEILHYLIGEVPHLYLFRPRPKEMKDFPHVLSRARTATEWSELEKMIVP